MDIKIFSRCLFLRESEALSLRDTLTLQGGASNYEVEPTSLTKVGKNDCVSFMGNWENCFEGFSFSFFMTCGICHK